MYTIYAGCVCACACSSAITIKRPSCGSYCGNSREIVLAQLYPLYMPPNTEQRSSSRIATVHNMASVVPSLSEHLRIRALYSRGDENARRYTDTVRHAITSPVFSRSRHARETKDEAITNNGGAETGATVSGLSTRTGDGRVCILRPMNSDNSGSFLEGNSCRKENRITCTAYPANVPDKCFLIG